ncbi:MAG: hypothetical protein WCT28_03220 [Patescibacteria group bacterium]|jgi:hypothetical protein
MFTISVGPFVLMGYFVPVIEEVLRTIVGPLAKAEDPTDTGGWFALWGISRDRGFSSEPIFGCMIGRVVGPYHDGRLRSIVFMENATEKAKRISDDSLRSSWQTRDSARGRYGGGIAITDRFVMAFSGLAEWADEMLMLIVAHRLHLINGSEIELIIQMSNNWRARDYFIREGVLRL